MINIIALKEFCETFISENPELKHMHLIIETDIAAATKQADKLTGDIIIATYPDSDSDVGTVDDYGENNTALIAILRKMNQGNLSWGNKLDFYAEKQKQMRVLKKWILDNYSRFFQSSKPIFKTTFENQTIGTYDGISVDMTVTDDDL